MLDQPVPNPLAKNPNFNTHKVFAAIGLILVVVLLVVGGVWAYVQNESKTKEEKDKSVKVTTSSAKPATKSAEKDETADWTTLTANTAVDSISGNSPATINYSYKYPNNWVKFTAEYSWNTVVSNNKDYEVGGVTKAGEVQVYASNVLQVSQLPSEESNITLGGKLAIKSITEPSTNSQDTRTVHYYVKSVTTKENNVIPGFSLVCSYYYSTTDSKHLENTCDLIASTFKFL